MAEARRRTLDALALVGLAGFGLQTVCRFFLACAACQTRAHGF
jgi:hypothetical protein